MPKIVLFFIFLTSLFADPLPKETLNIGILSFRPIDENQKIWQPLHDEMYALNPSLDVNITSGSLDEIEKLTQKNALDFVIIHPAAFVEMEYKYGITNIASIVRQDATKGVHLTRYGGVIVTLANSQDIHTLLDIRGKTIATTHKEGFAAMLMQQATLWDVGINVLRDCTMLYTGQPTDKVIHALLSGRADVGFVRTGYLEEMIAKGKLKKGTLRVINPRTVPNFPYLLSTKLYPEWAVAATSRPSTDTIKAFTVALYQIHTHKSKDFYAFSVPLSNQSARELMQKFHYYPFNTTPTLHDILQQYANAFILFFGLVTMGSLLFTLYYFLSKRKAFKQAKHIELILTTATDGIHVHDIQGNLILFSDSFAQMHGYSREEIAKLRIYDLNTLFDPSTIAQGIHELKHTSRIFETKHTRKDGTHFDIELHAKGITLEGEPYIFASARDISERKQTELNLLRHDTIFQNIAEGVYAIDNHNICTYINKAALHLLNIAPNDIMGRNPHDVFHYHQLDGQVYHNEECPIQLAVKEGKSAHFEDSFLRRDETFFPVLVTVSPIIQDTMVIGSVVTFSDNTEQKENQNQIIEEKNRYDSMAHHDPLTHLPNRLSLLETLEEKITHHREDSFALMFLDLDGFKEMNDSFGHRFGDELLRAFSQLLRSLLPDDTFISRTGGDEFVILISYNDDKEVIEKVLQRLINQLNDPFSIEHIDVYITASIGIALYPQDAFTHEGLLQKADTAMYNAKNMGKNTYSFYQSLFTEKALQRTILSTQLKKALQKGDLELYFQPQVDLTTGHIIGAEALMRWQTPTGMVSPAVFIPIAEESGLIFDLGKFALMQGCRTAVSLAQTGRLFGRIAINVSARQLTHFDFLHTLDQVMEQTHCDPRMIELEITESSILEYPEKMTALLCVIKSRGFHISIDDFGTGYSSLSYLRNLPIDKLKVDQSFVRNITHEPKNQTIVKTIIALAKGLGMSVIAEGVETQEEVDFCQANGMDSVQGYYYYKPMTLEAFTNVVSIHP